MTKVKSLTIVLLLLALMTWVIPSQAQTPDCQPDLTGINDLVATAQTQLASGSTTDVLASLQQIEQQIAAINAQCSKNVLTQMYKGETFSINYPAGWIPIALGTGGASSLPGVLLGSNLGGGVWGISAIPPTDKNPQTVLIIMDTPRQLASILAGFLGAKPAGDNDPIVYEQIDALGLLRAITGRADTQRFQFGDATTLESNGRSLAVAHFTVAPSDTLTLGGVLTFVKINDNQFLTLWGLALKDNENEISTLVQNMAASFAVISK